MSFSQKSSSLKVQNHLQRRAPYAINPMFVSFLKSLIFSRNFFKDNSISFEAFYNAVS